MAAARCKCRWHFPSDMRVAVKTVARDVELPQLLITVAFRCPRCQQIITAESTQEATENQKPKLIITGET